MFWVKFNDFFVYKNLQKKCAQRQSQQSKRKTAEKRQHFSLKKKF